MQSKYFLHAALCVSAMVLSNKVFAQACKDEALHQADKLLAFHSETDILKEIDSSSFKILKPISNPLNPKQKFQVFEIMGSIVSNEYRIHLIYLPVSTVCVLVGQEIIQLGNF